MSKDTLEHINKLLLARDKTKNAVEKKHKPICYYEVTTEDENHF